MAELDEKTLLREDKAAFLVAFVYEKTRRDSGQHGYRLTTGADDLVIHSNSWKQCRTVAAWFSEIGWPVRLSNINWQGYIRFVFEKLKPQFPMPGQLRNWRLVREYMRHHPTQREIRRKSPEELDELYRKIV